MVSFVRGGTVAGGKYRSEHGRTTGGTSELHAAIDGATACRAAVKAPDVASW